MFTLDINQLCERCPFLHIQNWFLCLSSHSAGYQEPMNGAVPLICPPVSCGIHSGISPASTWRAHSGAVFTAPQQILRARAWSLILLLIHKLDNHNPLLPRLMPHRHISVKQMSAPHSIPATHLLILMTFLLFFTPLLMCFLQDVLQSKYNPKND